MRYISSNVISFSMLVKDRKDSLRVNFLPVSTGGSSYSTDSEALIEALEKSPMFGNIYHRAPECVNETVGAKKKTKTSVKNKKIEVAEVVSWQDAIEYLVNNHNADVGKMVTPDEILAEAELRNVEFPKLK